MTPSQTRSVLKRFAQMKALVIGDLMLDHYIWGAVSRISPEAPVPVVEVFRESDMPGGAGNVASNMASLGADVFVVGVMGNDTSGDLLLSKLQNIPVHTESIVRTAERPTTSKSRVVAHHQQVVRFDREMKTGVSPELRRQIWGQIENLLPRMDAIVLSDYGKGVVDAGTIKALIPLARRRGIPITVDPKIENFGHYRRVTCVTPNLQEAMEGCNVRTVRTEQEVEALGRRILSKLATESVLITRGDKGMSLFEKRKPAFHIPTRAREMFDVTGAGDTVIATLTLALAAGAPLRLAAELANYAAGVVVGKIGTATLTGRELETALRANHS